MNKLYSKGSILRTNFAHIFDTVRKKGGCIIGAFSNDACNY